MKKHSEIILTPTECRGLLDKFMAHARKLYRESHKLHDRKMHPAAYTLMMQSIEEAGRALICLFGSFGFIEVKMRDIYPSSRRQRLASHALLLNWYFHANRLTAFVEQPTNGRECYRFPALLSMKFQKWVDLAIDMLYESYDYQELPSPDGSRRKRRPRKPRRVITWRSFPYFFRKRDFMIKWMSTIRDEIDKKDYYLSTPKNAVPFPLPMSLDKLMGVIKIMPQRKNGRITHFIAFRF